MHAILILDLKLQYSLEIPPTRLNKVANTSLNTSKMASFGFMRHQPHWDFMEVLRKLGQYNKCYLNPKTLFKPEQTPYLLVIKSFGHSGFYHNSWPYNIFYKLAHPAAWTLDLRSFSKSFTPTCTIWGK